MLTRGLLVGKSYEVGPDYRGVWGIYGSYDYISPQTFRVSTTGLSLGSTGHLWLTDDLSLEGTGMLGVGYTAVGTANGTASTDRNYNYGVTPQALLALRLTHGDKAALDVTGREYFVSKVASGTSGGHDNIVRLDAALTWRLYKQHAVSIRYLGNRRDASFPGAANGHQVRNTRGHLLHAARPGPLRLGRLALAAALAVGERIARRRAVPARDGGDGRSARPGSRRG